MRERNYYCIVDDDYIIILLIVLEMKICNGLITVMFENMWKHIKFDKLNENYRMKAHILFY